MRFCMLTTFYPPYHFGGDAVGIQRLVHSLARRGHGVEVIHDADAWRSLARRPDPTAPAEPPDPEGVRVHRLESRLGLLSPLLTQQSGRPLVHGRRIRRILEAGRFDVIHYHNVSLVGGPGILALGEAAKLYSAHEHWLVCPSHVLWRHGREPCTGRQCLRCVLRHRRPPQLWRATGLLERRLHHVDVFLAMSEFSRAKHREFGFPREMEVLPYFLPEDAPAPAAAAEPPHERPYFLFVGRLERLKGLHEVIPLWRDPPPADLLVVGTGGQEAELRAQAADLPGVRFLGRVDDELLARCYRHALALVIPSLCFETFGIIAIEAFARGVPVVARRRGPLTEIVESSGGGELFETEAECRAALVRLATDGAHRDGLARAGEAAWRERWTEEPVLERYLDIARGAVAGRAARRSTGGSEACARS